MKTIKVSQVRRGDMLVAWHGPPVAQEKARVDGGWWRVRTDRGDLILKSVADVKVGNHHVAVGR